MPNDRVGYQIDANLTVDHEEQQNQTREHLQPSLTYVDDDEFDHQETPHKANANEKLNQQRKASEKKRKDRPNDNAAHSVKQQEIPWEQKQDEDNRRNPSNNKGTQKTKKNVQTKEALKPNKDLTSEKQKRQDKQTVVVTGATIGDMSTDFLKQTA